MWRNSVAWVKEKPSHRGLKYISAVQGVGVVLSNEQVGRGLSRGQKGLIANCMVPATAHGHAWTTRRGSQQGSHARPENFFDFIRDDHVHFEQGRREVSGG